MALRQFEVLLVLPRGVSNNGLGTIILQKRLGAIIAQSEFLALFEVLLVVISCFLKVVLSFIIVGLFILGVFFFIVILSLLLAVNIRVLELGATFRLRLDWMIIMIARLPQPGLRFVGWILRIWFEFFSVALFLFLLFGV
jgi:hypothetical protein